MKISYRLLLLPFVPLILLFAFFYCAGDESGYEEEDFPTEGGEAS